MVAQVRSWAVQKSDEGWRLPVEQRRVSRCTFDHAFALEFHEGEQSAVLRIEGGFTILDREQVHRLTPSSPVNLGLAVALFGQVVQSARTSEEGKLEIAFEDGRSLTVAPNDRYEAWEFSGPGGVRVVCTPGGGISVWQPKDKPQGSDSLS